MHIVTGIPTPDAAERTPGAAVAIGNFDGVHRGHARVIGQAGEAARRLGATFGVVTFEPHPRSVFQPDAPPFRLTSAVQKARRLEALGVDRLHVLPFDRDLASVSAEAFARDVLALGVGARHVVVGEDFQFGRGREGDIAALKRFGGLYGFDVEAAEILGEGGAAFSSSAARAALQAGRPEQAAHLLGDWHRIEGVVEGGDRRGRELGFPTANVNLRGLLHPKFGIYAVRAEIFDGPTPRRL